MLASSVVDRGVMVRHAGLQCGRSWCVIVSMLASSVVDRGVIVSMLASSVVDRGV